MQRRAVQFGIVKIARDARPQVMCTLFGRNSRGTALKRLACCCCYLIHVSQMTLIGCAFLFVGAGLQRRRRLIKVIQYIAGGRRRRQRQGRRGRRIWRKRRQLDFVNAFLRFAAFGPPATRVSFSRLNAAQGMCVVFVFEGLARSFMICSGRFT